MPAPNPSDSAAQFILEVVAGPQQGATIPLRPGDFVIGRSPQRGIRLPHNEVAPNHCGLRVRTDQVIIAPGGITSPTLVNGQLLKQAQLLRVGDQVGIGPYQLILRVLTSGNERRFHAGDQVGPYRLMAELGSGSVGRVFEARDRDGLTVALKTLRLRLDWEPREEEHRRALFQREVESMQAVQHPNVVRCYGAGEHDGVPWIAMELMHGLNLREHLVTGRPSVERIERIMFQLCSAVAGVHDAGVIHRDLKPANVMLVGEDRHVCLADFGLAQKLGALHLEELDPPEFSTIIRVGRQVGTPAYMPPEQTQGLDADMRSDVWSLGAVLYELIGGRRPFPGADVRTVLTQVCQSCPEPLPDEVAPHLRGVVYKCLQKSPNRRFTTAREMVDTLHDRRLVQLLPVGAQGPNPQPLTACPFCGAPIEHALRCSHCPQNIFRYTDGQVLAVPIEGRTMLACGTCGATVGPDTGRCPTCGMVYSDLPPVGQTRSAHVLGEGGPLVVSLYDKALGVLTRCPFCNAPRENDGPRCPRCGFNARAYVTGRVKLDLIVGGWAISCAACGSSIDGPGEPHCPECGLNLSNGQFPDGTRFTDEVPGHLLRKLEAERGRAGG